MDTKKILEQEEGKSKLADFREILFTYLVYWKWFVICAAVAVAYTAFDLAKKNDEYIVSTSILMKSDRNSGSADNLMLETLGIRSTQRNLENETEIMRSKSVTLKVVNDLKIHTTYFIKKGLRLVDIYKNTPIYLDIDTNVVRNVRGEIRIEAVKGTDKNGYDVQVLYRNESQSYRLGNTPVSVSIGGIDFTLTKRPDYPVVAEDIVITVVSPDIVANHLSKTLIPSVLSKGSTILTMSLRTYNISKAIDVLEKLVYYYNELSINEKNQALVNTGKFIDERIVAIAKELGDVEREIEAYKKDYRLTDPQSNAGMVLGELKSIEQSVFDMDMQLNLLDYVDEFISDKNNEYSVIPTLGITDAAFNTMVDKYNQELVSRARMLHSSSVDNPSIAKIDQNIKVLREGVKNGIEATRKVIELEKSRVQKKGAEVDSKMNMAPEIERQMSEIMRQQSIKNELYIFLLQKREENALSRSLTVPTATIINMPEASGGAVYPQRSKSLMTALAVGLVIPAVIIFIIGLFNVTFKDKIDIERLTDIPVIGEISENETKESFVVKPKSTAPIVELFRLLRNNIQSILDTPERKVVCFTSTTTQEGKTFVSSNTALSFALARKKTILVGLDIRRPQIRKLFSISTSKGLVSYLSGKETDLDSLIIPSGVSEYLDLLPAGPIPPNPNELLINSSLGTVFEYLREKYEYIIVDSAPVGMVSDTFLLTQYADLNIYVMRANFSSRKYIEVLENLVKEDKLRQLYILVNAVNIRSKVYGYKRYGYGYGYGSRYGYSYGYGYGYGEPDTQHNKKRPFWRRWI
ncbi:MAG: polysaccharide biosynthesis tyrosine autokinase [Bacteroidetes bacterium]|uniref:Polysaccharide biosynthesis tyrosine autokinase n=1 Tax=Candidatus Caccoplasma merdipullorum TaxID=2840718 RepID=A0A9D9E4K3_9BACT|nr:polysaccharide biosynthesis tyrosine autokinase [Candidatus Caccoplasma merdipullorum]